MTIPPSITLPLLATPHAMNCRLGGVSGEPFDSLNLSYTVGDCKDAVQENRRRVLAELGQGTRRLASVRQVHGDRVLVLKAVPEYEETPDYDALVTNVPGLALLIQQADCQAVLLFDPVRRVVAAAHSGWRGSVANIIGKTVVAMRASFGCNPGDLRAAISPSLGPCCAEFVNYRRELPEWMWAFAVPEKQAHFDFWAMSRKQLELAGVPSAQIGVAGICTHCHPTYFSYRRARTESGGICGRNGSLIALAAK